MAGDASPPKVPLRMNIWHLPLGLLFLCVLCTVVTRPIRQKSYLPPSHPVAAEKYSWKECALMYVFSVFIFFNVMFLWENIRAVFHPRPRHLSLTSRYVDAKPTKMEKMEAFKYDTPMTPYEWVKCTFFIVTGIAFIRAILAVTLTLTGMAIMSVAGDRHKQPIRFRICASITKVLGVIVQSAMGVYHLYVYGSFALPEDCKLIIANHSCVVEVLLIFLLADFPSFVSRKENTNVPFFSGVAKTTQCILVDRAVSTSRQQTMEAIHKRAKDLHGPQLMIFPEGTTANQRTLLMFKKGAFEPGEPVQMVCIYFPYKHFNPAWMGRAVGGNGFQDIVLRLSCQFVNYAEVRPLPVYYPTEEEKKDPILYASHCQSMMAAVLQENISDAMFRDYAAAEALYAEKHRKEQ